MHLKFNKKINTAIYDISLSVYKYRSDYISIFNLRTISDTKNAPSSSKKFGFNLNVN